MASQLFSVQNPSNLGKTFLDAILSIPDGEKIKRCIQCGTCSGSCPTSYAMDYTPREIIASLRAGMLDRVLNSNTMWMCASCYTCTVRCPKGIKFTDAMYELKRLAIQYKLTPRGVTTPVLSEAFVSMVDKYGRNPEMQLMTKFYLKTNPFNLLRMAPMGWQMMIRKRLQTKPSSIQGIEDLRKIIRAAELEEATTTQARKNSKAVLQNPPSAREEVSR